MDHGVIHRRKPLVLHEALPTLFSDAFVHPLERETKAEQKVTEVIFDVENPRLIIDKWIDTNKLLSLLLTPRVRHKTFLLNGLIIVIIDNPLSLFLMLIISRLFPLVYTGSRAREVLRRTS